MRSADRAKNKWLLFWYQFCLACSMHGLVYFPLSRNRIETWFWIIIVTGSSAACASLLISSAVEWSNNPIQIVIKDPIVPRNDTKPVLVFCSDSLRYDERRLLKLFLNQFQFRCDSPNDCEQLQIRKDFKEALNGLQSPLDIVPWGYAGFLDEAVYSFEKNSPIYQLMNFLSIGECDGHNSQKFLNEICVGKVAEYSGLEPFDNDEYRLMAQLLSPQERTQILQDRVGHFMVGRGESLEELLGNKSYQMGPAQVNYKLREDWPAKDQWHDDNLGNKMHLALANSIIDRPFSNLGSLLHHFQRNETLGLERFYHYVVNCLMPNELHYNWLKSILSWLDPEDSPIDSKLELEVTVRQFHTLLKLTRLTGRLGHNLMPSENFMQAYQCILKKYPAKRSDLTFESLEYVDIDLFPEVRATQFYKTRLPFKVYQLVPEWRDQVFPVSKWATEKTLDNQVFRIPTNRIVNFDFVARDQQETDFVNYDLRHEAPLPMNNEEVFHCFGRVKELPGLQRELSQMDLVATLTINEVEHPLEDHLQHLITSKGICTSFDSPGLESVLRNKFITSFTSLYNTETSLANVESNSKLKIVFDLAGEASLSIHVMNRENFLNLAAGTGIQLYPGQMTTVTLETAVHEAAQEIRSIAQEERGCAFPDEDYVLRQSSFKHYSKSHCLLESIIVSLVKSFQCVPWIYVGFLSSSGTIVFCKALESHAFISNVTFLLASTDIIAGCPEDCEGVSFTISRDVQMLDGKKECTSLAILKKAYSHVNEPESRMAYISQGIGNKGNDFHWQLQRVCEEKVTTYYSVLSWVIDYMTLDSN